MNSNQAEDKFQKKIKVLLIAPSMKNVGGQSIQANRQLEAFAEEENVEMKFLANDPETPFENIKFLRTVFTSLKFWFSLLTEIPKNDIVHIFSSGTTSYIISTLPPLFISKLFGRKTILHYHTGEAETHLRDWKLTAQPTMEYFDKIVVPSQFLVDVFAKFGLEAKAIYNTVENENFIFRERNPLRPVFLTNRNFEAHYQVSDVLKAFQIIQKEFSEAELLIAGSGSEESKLRNLAEKLHLKNTKFLGRIEQTEMPEIYDKADIYLNSSIVDNMPLSFIEAFSCGLPIVSTDAGGIPYICENGETALLVKTNDFESLAREAIRILGDKNLAQKIIAKARENCVKYSKENVRRLWLNIYRSLISK